MQTMLNGYPATYPQYYPQFQPIQPNYQQNNVQNQQYPVQQQEQKTINGFDWVLGPEGAASYIVPAGKTFILFDAIPVLADQGIADVDAWENVGRRIRGLNQAEEPGTDSGSGDCRDPQVCPVGEQGADQKADRHAAGKRDPQARHFVRIVEAEIEDGPQDVGKPEKVGDDKDRKSF